MEVISVSSEFWVWNLDQLVDQVTWCSLQPLIAHILVFYQVVVWGTSWNIEIEVLYSLDYFLAAAKMALPSDNLASSLASWTNVRKDVVKTISKIHTSGYSTFSTTFLTRHNIIWILGSSSSTMWTGHLFLHHNRQCLPKIKVLQWQEHPHPQLRSLETPQVILLFNVHLMNLFLPQSIIKIFFMFIHEHFICFISRNTYQH